MTIEAERLNNLYYKRDYNDGYIAATNVAAYALKAMLENLKIDIKEDNETNL